MLEPSWKIDIVLTGSWRGATSVLLSNGKQHIVVDTGLPHEASHLIASLKAKGLDPSDIQTVINTHLHVDHVMNNILFPGSTIYASQQSYDWSLSMYSDVAQERNWEELVLKYYPEIPDHDLAKKNVNWLRKFALRWWDPKRLGGRSQFRWLEQAQLPDGLAIFLTSGHVPGHVSVIVQTGPDPVVIAGDALLSLQQDDNILTMIPHHRTRYEFDRVRILSFGGQIIPGHDRTFRATAASPGKDPIF